MRKNNTIVIQPEAGLLSRCIKNDKTAFKQLVAMYQQYAYNLAFKLVTDEENAKDIVQEAFIRIWRNLGNYRDKGRFTTWLYKVVTNLSYDKLKSNKIRNHVPLNQVDNSGYLIADKTGYESTGNENTEIIKQIRKISKGLAARQRMVFILRDLQNLTVKEVSEILHMSEGAVKTNLYLARMFIREKFYKSEKTGRIIK